MRDYKCCICGKPLVPSPAGSGYATCPEFHGKLVPCGKADLEIMRIGELKTVYPKMDRVRHGRYERDGVTYKRTRAVSPRRISYKVAPVLRGARN